VENPHLSLRGKGGDGFVIPTEHLSGFPVKSTGTQIKEVVMLYQNVVPTSPAEPKRGKKRPVLFVAIGGVFVLLVIIIVAAVFLLPRISPKGEQVMLGFPNRSGEADLYLLKLGQEEDKGVLIAEDASPASQVWFFFYEEEEYKGQVGGQYGGFIPNSNRVLYWYQDEDGEAVVHEITVGGREPSEIMTTDALPLQGSVFGNSDIMFLQETRDSQERCYAARSGQEAERLAKGDQCWVSADGSTAYFEKLDDGEITLSTIGIDGKNETVVLDEVEDVKSTRTSGDASHIAYLQQTDDGQQLYLIERRSGVVTEVSAELFSIPKYVFVPGGDTLFYIAENDEGMLELYTSGSATPIAEGVTLGATAGPEGQHLVYMVGDEDGEMTLYVHPMKGGDDVQVLTGDNLEYSIIRSPARILIREIEDYEVTLHSADMSGSSGVELFNEDDITLSNIYYVLDGKTLYLLIREEDGTNTLYVTPMDEADGFRLLDEWHQIGLLNLSSDGRQLVFWGQEDRGDDPVLYSIAVEDGADPIELDDDNEGFRNAVFTANGKEIVYTAETGSNPDDVDVCQVPANGSDKFQVLYEEAFLADVYWTELYPFSQIFWRTVESGTSFCPGALTIQVGETVEGEIEPGEQVCYRLRAQEGDLITLDVDTPRSQNLDSTLTFYNRDGLQLGYNDDGPSGYDPRLTVPINQTGLYFIIVQGLNSDGAGTYSLSVREGVADPTLANAQLLQPDSRTRGAITSSSTFYLEALDYGGYGNAYYFDGQNGDRITIDVYADSIGSDLDPQVYLMDITSDVLGGDDDGGSGYDSRLTYTLSSTGRYYILVVDVGESYGSADTYFYEILLSIR
jgi:Tol biopolymer transport system component